VVAAESFAASWTALAVRTIPEAVLPLSLCSLPSLGHGTRAPLPHPTPFASLRTQHSACVLVLCEGPRPYTNHHVTYSLMAQRRIAPGQETKMMTVRVGSAVRDEIAAEAQRTGRTIGDVMRERLTQNREQQAS
jgi:hypothetical protein